MSNILLIEPAYHSKFPPLGLMRISTFHKECGDVVTFARGKAPALREVGWHRIYVASLFTYDLPLTVETIKYYAPAVESPSDIFVGGIGATLLPRYIQERVQCRILEGPLDRPNLLGPDTPIIATQVPDYSLLDSVAWKYKPEDSYFCRITKGCIRKCKFCAVPLLEPVFGYYSSPRDQIRETEKRFGERQNLIFLDNNILAIDCFKSIIEDIREEGFEAGAKRNNRKRIVDFNQGLDARLITPEVAKLLASICLSPVRLAFDVDEIEDTYRRSVSILANCGFIEFTNYAIFNFDDTPSSFYHRLRVNVELSQELGIRITGFPMRYVPLDDVDRRYVSKGWRWRYLRGIQCVLLATRGLVSPSPEFFAAAFGESYDEFLEILSMPDRYIIYRNCFKDREADNWRNMYKKLSSNDQEEFLSVLAILNKSKDRKTEIKLYKKFGDLLEHYYPNGEVVRD